MKVKELIDTLMEYGDDLEVKVVQNYGDDDETSTAITEINDTNTEDGVVVELVIS